MREIFNSCNLTEAREKVKQIISRFSKIAPEFSRWVEDNIDEGLTCFHFSRQHRKRIRTTNNLERVNREIKRRTRVAVLFPNAESALRLVTGVLMEIHEDWITGVQYLDMNLSSTSSKELEEVLSV